MLHIRNKSFATRVSIYVLSFTLIVFSVIMGIFYTFSRNKVTELAIAKTHGELQNMASEINGLLMTVETTLDQSAWVVEKNLGDPDSLFNVINAVVRNNDLIVGSGIAFEPYYFKEKGKYFMPYASYINGKNETQTLGGQDYDYPCMDWYLIPKLLKKNYWSEPYYDAGGGNIIMTTYSMPLYDKKGNVYAVFTANISLTQFTDMVGDLKPYASSFTFLLSRNGSYITHRDRSKIMNETIFSDAYANNQLALESIGREMQEGHTGTEAVSFDGTPSYAFYTSVSNTGWSVCNVSSTHIILKELDTITTQIITLFLIGILTLFFITYAIIQRLMYPLKAFSASARDIATGRFDVQLHEVKTNDEVKDLYDSLTFMQHSLSEYVTELQLTTAAKERIESELSIAREIQMGMIPKIFPPFPERDDVDLHALLEPAKEVGGDLYDFFIEENRLYFIIGDVSGKGVPASLFMAITRSLFRTLSSHNLSPASIVTGMNNSISESNDSNMFVTLIIGILNLDTGLLKICNAGHTSPVLIRPDGTVSYVELKSHLFVGIMKDFHYEDEEIHLEKGSKFLLYTDGVTEAENSSQELYGEERLIETLTGKSTLNVRSIVKTVIASINGHVQSAAPSDDLTLLVIHYKPDNKQ